MIRRARSIVMVLVAVIAVLFMNAGTAAAATQVAYWGEYLNSTSTRFYNDWTNAKDRGHDGWCYKGVGNPNDYACTVDAHNDKRPLELLHPDCPSTDNPRICYKVQFGNVDRSHSGWLERWEISADPYHSGQMPYCMPEWLRWNRGYHDTPWTGKNQYTCGFWKFLYTGPS